MNTIGRTIKFSVWGESHGPSIGGLLDGYPAGIPIDGHELFLWMRRRWPKLPGITPRKEYDKVEFMSGLKNGITTGAPLAFRIVNKGQHPEDYKPLENAFRQGHSDLGLYYAFGEYADRAGGGYVSGRVTAAFMVAGYVSKQVLDRYGIIVSSRVSSIGDTKLNGPGRGSLGLDASAENSARKLLTDASLEKRALKSTVDITIYGLPPGLGSPLFASLDGDLAAAMFSVPGVKGVTFPDTGIISTDGYLTDSEGISGGFSVGDISFSVLFKAPASVSNTAIKMDGSPIRTNLRSDVCLGIRGRPVLESMTYFTLLDHIILSLRRRLTPAPGGLDDIRSKIDETDRKIMELISERTALGHDTLTKKNGNVIDTEVMKQRRELWRKAALELGISPETASVIINALMKESIERQTRTGEYIE